jgi:predicted small lipoprotein YifL
MKTILVMAAVLALAGCQKKGTASGADTSAMTADTGMGMTHSDSTMARDTTKK